MLCPLLPQDLRLNIAHMAAFQARVGPPRFGWHFPLPPVIAPQGTPCLVIRFWQIPLLTYPLRTPTLVCGVGPC